MASSRNARVSSSAKKAQYKRMKARSPATSLLSLPMVVCPVSPYRCDPTSTLPNRYIATASAPAPKESVADRRAWAAPWGSVPGAVGDEQDEQRCHGRERRRDGTREPEQWLKVFLDGNHVKEHVGQREEQRQSGQRPPQAAEEGEEGAQFGQEPRPLDGLRHDRPSQAPSTDCQPATHRSDGPLPGRPA